MDYNMAKKEIAAPKASKPEPKKEVKPAAPVKAKPAVQVKRAYPELVDTRLQQIRFRFQELKVEGLVVTYMPNIRYLTNFSGSNAMLFIYEDKLWFFTDDRYKEQVKTELYPLPNMEIFIARDVWTYCVDNKLIEKVESLAFEGDRVAYSDAVNIRNQIRPLKFKPSDPHEVERYTMPKSPEELESIKKACELAELTFKKIVKFIKPGVEEKAIANEISYIARKLGSEGDPFDIIVTSGPRGSLVHGAPSDRKIKAGDIVILDFGCKVNGFGSDITRTVAVGKATKEQKETYKLLVEAKEAAIRQVRPHMNGRHLDEIARSIIAKAGYGEFFEHSLGHGIGLVPHESPIITFRREDQIVPEDVVLAIEPGVYFPNKYGMRVEDNIFVKREGAIHLTKAPDELPII
jgi:Xaa-Pro aminopeptidase